MTSTRRTDPLHTSSFDIASDLKEAGCSNTPSRSQSRFRRARRLEVALSLVLLVAAGLLIRSFGELLAPGVMAG
jgi:hypothetical protein